MNDDHWNFYYADNSISSTPSDFALFATKYIDKDSLIVDVGCGNGRDSNYFSSLGHSVIGVDQCASAIKLARRHANVRDNKCEFYILDASSREFADLLNSKSLSKQNMVIYARFFLHSITEKEERIFLDTLSQATKTGTLILFEFRCPQDENLFKVFNDHRRRFIDTKLISDRLLDLSIGLIHRHTGRGLARFGTEDPFIGRLVCNKI